MVVPLLSALILLIYCNAKGKVSNFMSYQFFPLFVLKIIVLVHIGMEGNWNAHFGTGLRPGFDHVLSYCLGLAKLHEKKLRNNITLIYFSTTLLFERIMIWYDLVKVISEIIRIKHAILELDRWTTVNKSFPV